MCLLIVLRGFHHNHPVIVGGNRDERRDRKAAPPGLWVGERHRILSPRDRVAGGTWLAVDDRGRFAGITNLADTETLPDAPSRGLLPHVALDQDDLDAGVAAVTARVRADRHSGFQLVLCDAERTLVMQNGKDGLCTLDWQDEVLLITNQHGPGELEPRGLAGATRRQVDVGHQLDALLPLLRDPGGDGHHEICKTGERYGTVSSSLIGVGRTDPADLIWRYAPGSPDVTGFRDYGNLGRRLVEE